MHENVRIPMYARFAVAAIAALTLAGCNAAATDSPASSMPPPEATANAWLGDDRIAAAIKFRISVGLRSDEAWVRQVADDPAAAAGMLAYNVPLLPAEVDAVKDRYTDLHAILDIVDEYGALHPSEWAGATQDPSTNS